MPETMSERETRIYRETATVFDLIVDLFETGKLNVDTMDAALALGENYFAEKCARGDLLEDWRDFAYAELLA